MSIELWCYFIISSSASPFFASVFPSIRVFFIRVSSLEIMWWASVVVQSLLTLCNLMDCSTPGSSVLQSPGVCSNLCLLSQWWLSNYLIPLLLFFPFAFNLSQWQIYPMVNSFPTFQKRFFSLQLFSYCYFEILPFYILSCVLQNRRLMSLNPVCYWPSILNAGYCIIENELFWLLHYPSQFRRSAIPKLVSIGQDTLGIRVDSLSVMYTNHLSTTYFMWVPSQTHYQFSQPWKKLWNIIYSKSILSAVCGTCSHINYIYFLGKFKRKIYFIYIYIYIISANNKK